MKKGLKQFAFIIFSLMVVLGTVGCKTKTKSTVTTKTNPTSQSTTKSPSSSDKTNSSSQQTTKKTYTALNLKSGFDQTEFFMDELDEFSLANVVFEAQYSDGSKKDINPDDLTCEAPSQMVIGENDFTVKYTEEGVEHTFILTITLKVKTAADVEYTTMVFERGEGETTEVTVPALPEGAKLYDMFGSEIVLEENKVTLPVGETLVKMVDGEDTEYFLVKVGKKVSTVQDLINIQTDITAGKKEYYILMNDLDLSSQPLSPLGHIEFTEERVGEDKNLYPNFASDSNIPFNGVFDGNGFALVGYSIDLTEGRTLTHHNPAWNAGLIAYLGEEGVVKNLIIKHASVQGGQNGALLIGVNKGLVENVVFEESNSLFVHFGRGAAVSTYNYGVVRNVVSHIDKFDSKNGLIDMVIALEYDQVQEIVNGFVDKQDHTEVLGKQFVFIEDYGTVLKNDKFVAITNTPNAELNLGQDFEVKIAKAKGVTPAFEVYVNNVLSTTVTVEQNQETGKYYLAFAAGALDSGNIVMVRVASSENKEVIDALFITVKPATIVSIEPKDAITVIEGMDLDISQIKLVVTYSDGTKIELDVVEQVGYDKTKEPGVQTVRLVYGALEGQYYDAEVTVVAKEATGIEVRKGTKTSYEVGEQLDLTGYTYVVKYNNNTESEPVAITTEMIDETSYDMSEAGEYNVKVTYEGFDATFKIVVTEVSLTDINITGNLLKDTYKYGDTLTAADFASVTVEATYSDNSVTPLSFTDYSISYDFNKVGSADVRIAYNGISKNAFTVTVEDYEKSLSVEFNELGENDRFIYDIANDTDNFKDYFKSVKVIMASGAVKELTGSDLDLVKPVELKSGACQLGFKLVDSTTNETIVETENKVDVEVWYQVTLGEQWSYIQEHLDGYYVLASDITLTGSNNQIGVAPLVSNTTIDGEGNGNAETGQVGRAFTGKFDGKGHKIINFKVESKTYGDIESYYLGIFGWIGANAVVENFVVDGAVISGWQNLTFLAVRIDGTLQHVTILANSVIKHWTEAEGWPPVYAVYGQSCGGSLISDIVCYARTGLRGSTPITVEQRLASKDWGTVSDFYIGNPWPVEIKSIDTNNIQVSQGETLDLSTVFITVKLSDGTEIQTHPTSIEGELDTSTLGEKNVSFKYEANGHYALIVGTVTVIEHLDTMVVQLKEGKTGVVIPYNNGWNLANVTNWLDIITIQIEGETVTDMTGITAVTDKLSGESVKVTFDKEGCTSSSVTMIIDLEIKDYESFMAINDNPDGRFVVTGDVFFSSTQKTTSQSYITAPFSGYLDGQGHYLYEFNINTTSSNAGLFKGTDDNRMTGTIKNLRLIGKVKSTASYVGAICMRNDGVIENCYINVITEGDKYVGGIVNNNYGTISGCLVLGNVTGNDKVGGIVRKTQAGGTTVNCVAINYGNTGAHASEPDGTETNINSVPVIGVIDSNTFGIDDDLYNELIKLTFKECKVLWKDNSNEITECAVGHEFNKDEIELRVYCNNEDQPLKFEIKNIEVDTSVAGENIPLVLTIEEGYQQTITLTIYITVKATE